MSRTLDARFETGVKAAGLTTPMVRNAVRSVYSTLDAVDIALKRHGVGRLTELIELANLSAILGNILAESLVRESEGLFRRARPHQYQDLRPAGPGAYPIEIKSKWHWRRTGPRGTFRRRVTTSCCGTYSVTTLVILCENSAATWCGWIWEIRLGWIGEEHFSFSSTPGDSGKTAVVSVEGMRQLRVLYFDPRFSPYAHNDLYLRKYSPTIDQTVLEL